ncbi:type VII secretion target [Mycobacterium sp. ACS4331]|uniref:WXG100 family type VII secretion target n=1 Tax=Mycobacterium sp. ACS4331 TaxID=1834121 RepID=UPI0018D43C13|nr:type VII secretion target [Mycobacterium sp. ACS4331]
MSTSDVIYSADHLDSIALQAAAERRALAVELSGLTDAWQSEGRPGFVAFTEAVHRQSERIQQEVTDVADKLRHAAREYTSTAHQGAELLRYHHGRPPTP